MTDAELNATFDRIATSFDRTGSGRSYTAGMKTAVSIPDHIFERAERLASERRRSRSEVYAAALDEYLVRHAGDEVTDAMNRVCDKVPANSDAFLAAAGKRVLANTEW